MDENRLCVISPALDAEMKPTNNLLYIKFHQQKKIGFSFCVLIKIVFQNLYNQFFLLYLFKMALGNFQKKNLILTFCLICNKTNMKIWKMYIIRHLEKKKIFQPIERMMTFFIAKFSYNKPLFFD